MSSTSKKPKPSKTPTGSKRISVRNARVPRPNPTLRTRNRTPKQGVQKGPFSRLSSLACAYAEALVDPFEGPLACIPDFPAIPSQKIRTYAKGTAYTGTAGFGYVALSPYAAVVSDVDSVNCTSAASVGTTINFAANVNQRSNSPFTSAQLGTSELLAKYRVVASGLRVRYMGTELNRGGLCVGYQHPTHAALDGSSFTDVDGAQSSVRFPVERTKWLKVTHCPVLSNELQYLAVPGSMVNNGYLAFVFSAPDPATPMAIEWETYTICEFNGRNLASVSLSGADPVGFAAVHTVANSGAMLPNSTPGPVARQTFLQKVIDWGERTASSFFSGVGHFLENTGDRFVTIGATALENALL